MSDINITVNDEIVNIDVIDEPVLVNVVNSPGQQGPAGPGVPVGGTAGQILAKASATNYDTEWINNYAKYLATNVRNQTGSTIGAFQVVYISGATGNKPLISLADADTEATSTKTYGVTATAIANNGTGDVVTAGELSGIDTSAFNEGDLLWLSTTAGGVVTSPPAEPAHAVFIGYVVRSHPTLGTIDVSIQNGYELNELHGVQITTPTDNQGLFYNSTSTLWENKTIATALGYTPVPTSRTITINGVTFDLSADRSYTVAAGISGSGAAGQVTYWSGTNSQTGSNKFIWDNSAESLTLNCEGTGLRGLRVNQFSNDIAAASIVFRKSRGTIASPANVLQYDLISAFEFSARVGGVNTENRSLFGANMATATGIGMYFIAGSTNGNLSPNLYIHPTGNVVVNGGGSITTGGTLDGGQRLQVYGDTLLRGSGNTNTTTALTVQDSAGVDMLIMRNDGLLRIVKRYINTSQDLNVGFGASNDGSAYNAAGLGQLFSTANRTSAGVNYSFFGGNITNTSGAFYHLRTAGVPNFAPTSGTGTFFIASLEATINQQGGANGITRGLYVNPTLTAAADFRAIETARGNIVFSNLPTSSAGLPTGALWNNGGVINIV